MKVLQVISSFPPAYDYGGPPRSAYNLSKSLVDRGHDVTVFTTDALNAEKRVDIAKDPKVEAGVEIYRFKNISNTLSWKNIPLAPRLLTALLRKAQDFDVIHVHEYRSFHTLFAHLTSNIYNIPFVLQPRGSMPRTEESSLKVFFDKITGTDIAYAADRIIASSTIESSQFDSIVPELNPDQIAHVPNGISAEEYSILPNSGKFRDRFSIDKSDNIVLFLGRLHPRKGGDLLIDAVSQLSCDDVQLVFVGPNEGAKEEWEIMADQNGIGNQTMFVGPLYDSEKLQAYVDADAFVLPSKNEFESFGNVVIEAMACGTPAVVTDVCGIAEWINHADCHAVPPTSPALINGLTNVLDSLSSAKSIRQYILENFSWDAVASDTEAVYEEVIQ